VLPIFSLSGFHVLPLRSNPASAVSLLCCLLEETEGGAKAASGGRNAVVADDVVDAATTAKVKDVVNFILCCCSLLVWLENAAASIDLMPKTLLLTLDIDRRRDSSS